MTRQQKTFITRRLRTLLRQVQEERIEVISDFDETASMLSYDLDEGVKLFALVFRKAK